MVLAFCHVTSFVECGPVPSENGPYLGYAVTVKFYIHGSHLLTNKFIPLQFLSVLGCLLFKTPKLIFSVMVGI